MNLAQTVSRPRHQQLAIGYPVGTAGSETFQGGFKVLGVENGLGSNANPINLVVDNHGELPFTISVLQSNDNGDSDAYAAINLQHKGASVASIVVAPGARVVCDIILLTKVWVKLNVLASSTPFGVATFVNPIGELIPVRTADT